MDAWMNGWMDGGGGGAMARGVFWWGEVDDGERWMMEMVRDLSRVSIYVDLVRQKRRNDSVYM